MDVEYLIDEEDLVEITGLSPRSIRSKFKRFRVEDKEYDYQAIFEELLKEKYSNKNKQIFVDVEMLARILGVTEKTIQNYKNKKILIAETNGLFDLIDNLERYNNETNEHNKILKVKREREEVRKERELLQLDIDEGKYIPLELYGLILKDTVVSFRQELLRTATYLSINLKTEPQSQWKKYIQKTLGDTLTNFSKLSEEIEEKIIAKVKNEQET
ncbi:MAG: hypothetical protein ACRDBY_03545 [Cetobacterium sp.]